MWHVGEVCASLFCRLGIKGCGRPFSPITTCTAVREEWDAPVPSTGRLLLEWQGIADCRTFLPFPPSDEEPSPPFDSIKGSQGTTPLPFFFLRALLREPRNQATSPPRSPYYARLHQHHHTPNPFSLFFPFLHIRRLGTNKDSSFPPPFFSSPTLGSA